MISRTHIVLVVCCWLVAATGDIFDELDEQTDGASQRLGFLQMSPQERKLAEALSQIEELNSQIQQITTRRDDTPTPQEDDVSKIPCRGVVRQSAKESCHACQAEFTYALTEDNWYLIGIAYGFKKEFQQLIDQTRNRLGQGLLYLAFSPQRDICLASDDLKERVDVDSVLRLFHGHGLREYQVQCPLFALPQFMMAQLFIVRATYDTDTKQFSYANFHLVTNVESPPGGDINDLAMDIRDQQITVVYKGNLRVESTALPFQFDKRQGTENMEQVRFAVPMKQHSFVLHTFAHQYLSPVYQAQLTQFVSQYAGEEAQLQLSTIENDQELNITFTVQ